jgi:hypothetical protein
VGSPKAQHKWLEPQIQKWVGGVKALAQVATRFPQTAYAGLVKSLQLELQYLQRVLPDVSADFAPVKQAIAHLFLPILLDKDQGGIGNLRALLALLVCQAGIGLPSPVDMAYQCY